MHLSNRVPADKIVHFGMYSVFAVLLLWSLFKILDISSMNFKLLLLVFLFVFSYGLFMEFLQFITHTGRKAEASDIMANGLGSLAGVLTFLIWDKLILIKR
jgi:VanZ family protein